MIVPSKIYNLTYRLLTKIKKNDDVRLEKKYSYTGQEACDCIYNKLASSEPCMIARFGRNELNAITRNLSNRYSLYKKVSNYLNGKEDFFLYHKNIFKELKNNAGVFDINEKKLIHFTDIYLKSIPNIDILGSWVREEKYVEKYYSNSIKTVPLGDLEPYSFENPWSKVLKGKNVLVVHPFSETIRQQYNRRELLFKNPDVLPEFNLITFKAVQSIAGQKVEYSSWFDALYDMEDKISNIDFDIAIIGCGAYGMPLASFVKNLGKQVVHLGGATQLMFGIRGKRWDENPAFQKYINEYWCYPSKVETPENASIVENACYW